MKQTKIKIAITSAILLSSLFFNKSMALKDGEKFKDWTVKCEVINPDTNEEICGISQVVKDKKDTPLASIFIVKNKEQDKTVALIKVPLLVTLQAGVGVAIDKKEVARLPYTVCDPAGCNAALPISKEVEKSLVKGSKLQLGLFYRNKEVGLEASLSGISKALKKL